MTRPAGGGVVIPPTQADIKSALATIPGTNDWINQPATQTMLGQGATPAQQLAAIAVGLQNKQAHQGAGGGGGSSSSVPGPSLSDVLGSLLGSAPTMADFFDPSTYQSALASLASGQQNANSTINSAYDKAAASQKQIDQIAAQNTANEQSLLNTDLGNASSQVNNFVNQANALAGGQGGQVQARMAGLQAQLAEQQAQEKMMNQQLGAITQYNTTQGESSLTSDRAQALAALASAIGSARGKINTQMASDQSKANSSYQNALAQYNTKAQNYIKSAEQAVAKNGPAGGVNWGKSTLAAWMQKGASGDQNAKALASAAQNLIAPIPVGTSGSSRAPKYNEAMAGLVAHAQELGGTKSPMFGILANWLGNYYGVFKNTLSGSSGPSDQDLANYLAQTYGLGG